MRMGLSPSELKLFSEAQLRWFAYPRAFVSSGILFRKRTIEFSYSQRPCVDSGTDFFIIIGAGRANDNLIEPDAGNLIV